MNKVAYLDECRGVPDYPAPVDFVRHPLSLVLRCTVSSRSQLIGGPQALGEIGDYL